MSIGRALQIKDIMSVGGILAEFAESFARLYSKDPMTQGFCMYEILSFLNFVSISNMKQRCVIGSFFSDFVFKKVILCSAEFFLGCFQIQ